MSGRGGSNTRSSAMKKGAAGKLKDSLSKYEVVTNSKRKCRRDNEVNDEDDDDGGGKKKNRTAFPRKSGAHYDNDDDFTPEEEEEEEEEEEVYEEEEEEDGEDDDPSFESPGKKTTKKQSSSTSTTTKKGSTTTSAKKRKEKEKEQLKNHMKTLQEDPTVIFIRYCIDNPKQPERKPRWGDCKAAYKEYFDRNLFTTNRDPYKNVLNHFKKEMDDDVNCITKLEEYHSSFFFYDPGTISSPYDTADDYDWDTKSSAIPISSRNELIKALALSGNLVEVELDNNNESDNILDCGEGTNNAADDDGDSNNTDGLNRMGGTLESTSGGTSGTSNADTRSIDSSNADTRIRTSSGTGTSNRSSNADTRIDSSNGYTRIGTSSGTDNGTGTKKKVIVLDIIVRATRKNKAGSTNKKKKTKSKERSNTNDNAADADADADAEDRWIKFNIRSLTNLDPSNDNCWVDNKVIGKFQRSFEDIDAMKVGEIFCTVRKVLIEHEEGLKLHIGNKSALFVTYDRRSRNHIRMKQVDRSEDLISHLKSLANKTKTDLQVDVSIGAKNDSDTIMAELTTTQALILSQQERDDEPRKKKLKSNAREERSASQSHDSTNLQAIRVLSFSTDSPFQFCFSSEMQGIIAKRMELDKRFQEQVKLAVHSSNYDGLSFNFINGDVSLMKHHIKFDIDNHEYIPEIRNDGKQYAPHALPHGNSKDGDGGGGGMAGTLKEALDNNTEKLSTMIKKVSKKATNITFTMVGREGKSLSLFASDIVSCEDGKSLLIVADEEDDDDLFSYSDDEYESMFTHKTHTLRFNFVDFNTSVMLDRFKTRSIDDILMGKKTTVMIEMSIVPKAASSSNTRRIQL